MCIFFFAEAPALAPPPPQWTRSIQMNQRAAFFHARPRDLVNQALIRRRSQTQWKPQCTFAWCHLPGKSGPECSLGVQMSSQNYRTMDTTEVYKCRAENKLTKHEPETVWWCKESNRNYFNCPLWVEKHRMEAFKYILVACDTYCTLHYNKTRQRRNNGCIKSNTKSFFGAHLFLCIHSCCWCVRLKLQPLCKSNASMEPHRTEYLHAE